MLQYENMLTSIRQVMDYVIYLKIIKLDFTILAIGVLFLTLEYSLDNKKKINLKMKFEKINWLSAYSSL